MTNLFSVKYISMYCNEIRDIDYTNKPRLILRRSVCSLYLIDIFTITVERLAHMF